MTASSPLTELLDRYPLPPVDGDKDDRGTAVLLAGAPTCPGAAILAGSAALRAGAGRIQLVTHPDIATALGVAVPEAFVTSWRPGDAVPEDVIGRLGAADAVVVGPGMDDGAAEMATSVVEHIPDAVPLLLDARAIPAASALRSRRPVVLPNPKEARRLLGGLGLPDGDGDDDDPAALARSLTDALGAPLAVRGEVTVVANGDEVWSRAGGDPGLGTAGSGDVLVGIAAGLLARGLEPLAAICWAVAAHAGAGELLGRGRSNPGYLARELLDAVPSAFERFAARGCC